MTTWIVTKQGPIDRRPPGTDVTGLYDAETMARLELEGYVRPKSKKSKAKAKDAEVTDGS